METRLLRMLTSLESRSLRFFRVAAASLEADDSVTIERDDADDDTDDSSSATRFRVNIGPAGTGINATICKSNRSANTQINQLYVWGLRSRNGFPDPGIRD